MRTLPTALTDEINKEFFRKVHLVEIAFSTPVYYTDADMDIIYNGHIYLSKSIRFDETKYSLLPRADSISFTIDNTSLEFSAIVMSEETRAKDCVVYSAAVDEYLTVLGSVAIFVGYLDRVEIDNKEARFDVFNSFIKWNTPTPRRTHVVTCPWTFKDTTTCRYVGAETTCDKSWDDCNTVKLNHPNFGGYRWLTILEGGKQIYWGRLPG